VKVLAASSDSIIKNDHNPRPNMKKPRNPVPMLLTAVAMSACSPNGGNLISLNPNTELSSPLGSLPDGGLNLSAYVISLGETSPGAISCQQAQSGQIDGYRINRSLGIVVGTNDASDLHTGTYDVVLPLAGPSDGGPFAVLGLLDSDGGTIGTGIDGTVTLSQVVLGSSGTIGGSYSSTLVGADGGTVGTISGSFSAPICILSF
jgi:hypothetical protein